MLAGSWADRGSARCSELGAAALVTGVASARSRSPSALAGTDAERPRHAAALRPGGLRPRPRPRPAARSAVVVRRRRRAGGARRLRRRRPRRAARHLDHALQRQPDLETSSHESHIRITPPSETARRYGGPFRFGDPRDSAGWPPTTTRPVSAGRLHRPRLGALRPRPHRHRPAGRAGGAAHHGRGAGRPGRPQPRAAGGDGRLLLPDARGSSTWRPRRASTWSSTRTRPPA